VADDEEGAGLLLTSLMDHVDAWRFSFSYLSRSP